MPPVTALMRRVRADVEAALSPDNNREMSEGPTFSDAREVIMTMSEYEERFRPPTPSLHQTFTEVRGPNRGGRRSRRVGCASGSAARLSSLTPSASNARRK